MAMSTRINENHKVLHVMVSGKFDLNEAKRSFLQVMEAVKKHDAAKVLIDGRGITGEPSVIERFLYGEFAAHIATWAVANAGGDAHPQFSFALIYPTLDTRRLGETVAANRGMNVRAFDNIDSAASWLGVDPTEIGVLAESDVDAAS